MVMMKVSFSPFVCKLQAAASHNAAGEGKGQGGGKIK